MEGYPGYLLAKISNDTAEEKPLNVCQKFEQSQKRARTELERTQVSSNAGEYFLAIWKHEQAALPEEALTDNVVMAIVKTVGLVYSSNTLGKYRKSCLPEFCGRGWRWVA